MTKILCIAGPTASGKSVRAIQEALARRGEIISVDSRQVYSGLDIGTEKLPTAERQGVPHHLIDIRDPHERYSAGVFVMDAQRLTEEISARGNVPIFVGGTHFYFDALLSGIPHVVPNADLRLELERLSNERLFEQVRIRDPKRAGELDPKNRRRLIRALEIIEHLGAVPLRIKDIRCPNIHPEIRTSDVQTYDVEWIIIDPPTEELRTRIDARLQSAFDRGLIEEVCRIREKVGDTRLNELGLEYKIVGEYLRSENLEVELPSGSPTAKLMPILSARLWQYARRQKAWLRKLRTETIDLQQPQSHSHS